MAGRLDRMDRAAGAALAAARKRPRDMLPAPDTAFEFHACVSVSSYLARTNFGKRSTATLLTGLILI